MARSARLVVPGPPHHVTQRGNRRLPVFFSEQDYRAYAELLAKGCAKAGTEIWAYCLMPNHVHLILVPSHADGLRAALAEAHRRHSLELNRREAWCGHLWQSRFASFPMDQGHLLACARYVELNPVRARLAATPWAWPWSSAKAHLAGKDDGLVRVAPLLERVADWRSFLAAGLSATEGDAIRSHERSGHPQGDDRFFARLKTILGRDVKPRHPGRPAGKSAPN